MDLQQILFMIAPSLAGVSLTTILTTLCGRYIKKKLNKKINEVSENEQFKKINTKLDNIQEDINKIRGRRR